MYSESVAIAFVIVLSQTGHTSKKDKHLMTQLLSSSLLEALQQVSVSCTGVDALINCL